MIMRQYSSGNTVPLATARAEAIALLPADARLVRSTTSEGDPLDIYHSEGLLAQFPANTIGQIPWYNDEAGTFSVGYQRDTSGTVMAVYLGATGTP